MNEAPVLLKNNYMQKINQDKNKFNQTVLSKRVKLICKLYPMVLSVFKIKLGIMLIHDWHLLNIINPIIHPIVHFIKSKKTRF